LKKARKEKEEQTKADVEAIKDEIEGEKAKGGINTKTDKDIAKLSKAADKAKGLESRIIPESTITKKAKEPEADA